MLLPILLILASCAFLFLGAELLVRGGSSLALKLGLTPLVVGLTVVAYGTSTPELLVSLKAAFAGNPDIAIGNVVGSNIFNIAVILGLSALVLPIKTNLQVLKWDAPLVVLATLLVPLTFLDGVVSSFEGACLVLAALLYTWWAIRLARRDERLGHEAHVDVPEIRRRPSVVLDLLKIVAGLAVLAFSSRILVENAVVVAKIAGLSDTVIGLTIIAAGTSMPELATSMVAALRGQSDIALGNVLGSSLFNLFFVLGGAAVVAPVSTSGLQIFDLVALAVITTLMLPFLFTGRSLNRVEGGILFLSYLIYLGVMWPK
ncbi:calcium/sodium antiporter [Luteolibacter sp. GHJ8]|uniref:Calcium/sodium antiporter n=1 Tax=Luteolibacter rhizosphaerae TaxID=2989719 RepID=A0ABT3G906_9BACT|nr:calcium/sodium antiporter [Luteolibacter rhizosphaerae]MCW1916332.1 calcium/sodium antiporter [Luteolibacter rhizosphaerae]